MKAFIKTFIILFLLFCTAQTSSSEQKYTFLQYNKRPAEIQKSIGLRLSAPVHNGKLLQMRVALPIPKLRNVGEIQTPPASAFQDTQKPGGLSSGLKSLFFGPRVGLEANENQPVTFIEKANLFVPLAPFQVYSVNGIKGFAASAFLGPRVGMEIKERKIRKVEWLGLVPVIGVTYHLLTSHPSKTTVLIEIASAALLSRLFPAIEAFRGKTMTEIERAENLKR